MFAFSCYSYLLSKYIVISLAKYVCNSISSTTYAGVMNIRKSGLCLRNSFLFYVKVSSVGNLSLLWSKL